MNLDEDGFVEIVFLDKYGNCQGSSSRQKGFCTKGQGFTIPKKLVELAENDKLTKDLLLDMEYTELLRLATHPAAKDYIWKNLGIRGVPLKSHFPNGDPIVLWDHQIKTLEWMKTRELMNPVNVHGLKGGIVSIKMGLGKTAVALTYIMMREKGEFPSLVVASKTIMNEWRTQGIEKFFGKNLKVLYFHKDIIGKTAFDAMSRKDICSYDIVMTTYDVCTQACKKYPYHEQTYEIGEDNTLMKGKIVAVHCRTREQADKPNVKGSGILYCTPWERVICDESQRYANPKTQTYKCIMGLYGKYKWCLTGTPIRNFDTDIWAQLRFCGYSSVAQTVEWKRMGLAYFRDHKLGDAIFTMAYKDTNIVLPPKTENVNFITLTGKHKIFYDWILGETIDTYDEMMKGNCNFACVLAMFTALRQCAIAPYLFTAQSKRSKMSKAAKIAQEKAIKKFNTKFAGSEMYKWLTDKTTDSGMNSCKIREIVRELSLIPKGEKVTIFSSFTSCLDLLADAVKFYIPGYKLLQVDGATTGQERSDLIDQFRDDPSVSAIFLTYRVGSEGLTLTEANHCICIEPWWTSAVHNQAKARCWRPGQKKDVFVHNILTQDTIEEKVMEICKGKEDMASSFLDGTTKSLEKATKLDKFTLGRILGIR